MNYLKESLPKRFWSKVDKEGPIHPKYGQCWTWTGAIIGHGYGHIGIGKRGLGSIRAHRLAWEIAKGPIPDGLFVLHRCDNRSCVNPDHLFLGTDADNQSDSVSKDRSARGERSGLARLTENKVREIRDLHASGVNRHVIGEMYSISASTVSGIVGRSRWKHVI